MLRSIVPPSIIIAFALAHSAIAQGTPTRTSELAGTWLGALALEMPFRVVVNVRANDASLAGTIDFPDQGVRGLPLTQLTADRDSLHLRLAPSQISFDGRVASADSIVGTFAQGAQRFPLTLRRTAADQLRALERSQEPKRPYPYREENLRIDADSGVALAGTLTVPNTPGPHPVVVLLSGSGPLDRDASVAGHRPFLVIADALTRRGYAVLRYAKRGVPPSSGNFATSSMDNFARDAEAAVRAARANPSVHANRVILLGHSEGAMIAARIAAEDPGIFATVLIGAPAMRGDSLMVSRASTLLASRGVPDSLVRKDAVLRMAMFRAILSPGDEASTRARTRSVIERELQRFTSSEQATLGYSRESWNAGAEVFLAQLPWFRQWLPFDPIANYRRMHGPVLVVYGSKDWQVPADANAPRVRTALSNREWSGDVEVLADVNHQMQTAQTGSPAEYGRISETVSLVLLDRIMNWLERVR